jgi:hypothetical protein
MKKLSFTEKNSFVLRHRSAKYFSLDLDLFRRHYLTHRLNSDLARANMHTYERLDGQMLYVLLDSVPPEEILAGRNPVAEPPAKPGSENPGPENQEIEALKQRMDELEESGEVNRDEIDELRSSLEDSETSIEKLQSIIEELEKKAFRKKKANRKNSPV